ncbi:hypothetical protein D3C77_446820 [compost metagenome]
MREIADGEDVRIRGARLSIDDDAVIADQPGLPREIVIGNRPDPHQDRVAMQHPAVRQSNARDMAVQPLEALDLDPEVEPHALRLVFRPKEVGQDRTGDAGQKAVLALQDIDVGAEFARRRCNLKTDIAAADDGQTETGLEIGLDPLGVVDRSELKKAVQFTPRKDQTTRPCARGEHQGVIGEGFVRREGQGFGGAVDPDHARGGSQIDTDLRIPVARPQQQPVLGKLAL